MPVYFPSMFLLYAGDVRDSQRMSREQLTVGSRSFILLCWAFSIHYIFMKLSSQVVLCNENNLHALKFAQEKTVYIYVCVLFMWLKLSISFHFIQSIRILFNITCRHWQHEIKILLSYITHFVCLLPVPFCAHILLTFAIMGQHHLSSHAGPSQFLSVILLLSLRC